MPRIVISTCYGGYGLSAQAEAYLHDIYDVEFPRELPRDNPALVATVEKLGALANGPHAKLKIVDVPDGVIWEIEEYDGLEWVAETHRTWR